MKKEHVFLAANGSSLARVKKVADQWVVSHSLEGIKINCLVRDPQNSQIVYLGTQNNGMLKTNDAGVSWQPIGGCGVATPHPTIHSQAE